MSYFGPTYKTMIRTMKRRHSARVIFICHNVTPHEPSQLDSVLTRYALDVSDAFLIMSEEVKRDVIRFRPKAPVQLSPLPLNESFSPTPPRQKTRSELCLSSKTHMLLFFGLVR